MHGHSEDHGSASQLAQLKRAIALALPMGASLQAEMKRPLMLDVYATWAAVTNRGNNVFCSLSFSLTRPMLDAYVKQTEQQRALTRDRLTEWTSWIIGAHLHSPSAVSGLQVIAVVPLKVFSTN